MRVFSLDTGRLHPETYRFIERVRDHYNMPIEMLLPDAQDVQDLVTRKGLFSFYRDGHQECCAIRKIKPLRRHLGGLDAWITGQRRDQSLTRIELPTEQDDRCVFDGRSPHRQIQSARRRGLPPTSGATSAQTTFPTTRCTTQDS